MTSPEPSKPTVPPGRTYQQRRTRYLNSGTSSTAPPAAAGVVLASSLRPENMKAETTSRIALGKPRPILRLEHKRIKAGVDQSLRKVLAMLADGKLNWPLTLTGPVGTGKTCAALYFADCAGPGCVYKILAELMDDISAAGKGLYYDEHGDRVFIHRYWRNWEEARLTVLDELGTRQKMPDWLYETLKRAMDLRQGKPAIYVTNLSIQQIADLIDDRIASRLDAGTVFELLGQDRRVQS